MNSTLGGKYDRKRGRERSDGALQKSQKRKHRLPVDKKEVRQLGAQRFPQSHAQAYIPRFTGSNSGLASSDPGSELSDETPDPEFVKNKPLHNAGVFSLK